MTIDQDMLERSRVEGNIGMTATETICLNLVNDRGGLMRDVVVAVTTIDTSASSKHGQCSFQPFVLYI